MDKKTYKKLFYIIDKILWEDWDPICCNGDLDIRDEYSGYTPQIVKLIWENKDSKRISKQLVQFTILDMGMEPQKAIDYNG